MDSYIIQVQHQDELTVLIDKLIHTQAERVYLLVPDNSRIAQHALNFRLIKREADSLNKEVVIVSSSPRVQALALKSQLQAHQETSDLKESASVGEAEPYSPPKLSDILVPSVPILTNEKNDPEKENVNAEKDKKTRKIKKTKDKSKDFFEDRRSEKITAFWTKRPELKLPKFQRIGMGRIPWFNIRLSSSAALRALLLFLILISLASASVTFYFVLPRAKIYIKPAVEKISADFYVTGDISASSVGAKGDSREFILPAQIFEKFLESSRVVLATGEEEVREKSRGTITVYNSYSSSPQTLVKTTRFVSEGGKLFRTTETIVVPGAEVEDGRIVPSFTNVEVIASEPGSEYNIGPSTFSIPGFKGTPKYLAFYGKSEKSMTGGEIGTVRVIKDEDYKNAEKEIGRELEAKIDKSLDDLLPEGFFIPDGAKYISDMKLESSGGVGDRKNEITMKGTMSSKAFALRNRDIELLFASDFEVNFPQKQLSENGAERIFWISEKFFEKGIVRMKISMSQDAVARLDNLEIAGGVRGKDEAGVRSFLSSYPEIDEARLTFWPFWVRKIPNDENKIEIIIE